MSELDAPLDNLTRSTAAVAANTDGEALTSMNDLRKEIVKMGRKIETLNQRTESTGVDGAVIDALDEQMIML